MALLRRRSGNRARLQTHPRHMAAINRRRALPAPGLRRSDLGAEQERVGVRGGQRPAGAQEPHLRARAVHVRQRAARRPPSHVPDLSRRARFRRLLSVDQHSRRSHRAHRCARHRRRGLVLCRIRVLRNGEADARHWAGYRVCGRVRHAQGAVQERYWPDGPALYRSGLGRWCQADQQ